MKTINKTKLKKDKVKKKTVVKPKKEKVLVVAQEIKFARLLSGNEKKTRDRVLKSLKKWLLNCFEKNHQFKEDDFLRVWKGLFYAVWMSDKPLVQEELCDNIAGVLDIFPPENVKDAMLMLKAGFRALATEWFGLDQHRMDKFLMLVRRYLRGGFRVLQRCGWTDESCEMFADMMEANDGLFACKTPLYARNAMSMILHVTECYIEELSKVSKGNIPPSSLSTVVRPLCVYVCAGSLPALCVASRRALTALMRHSDSYIQEQNKTRAWEKMGCPAGGPDALELVSDDDDEETESGDEVEQDDDEDSPLDPRAGRVNVSLTPLPVDEAASFIVDVLKKQLPHTTSHAHKRVKLCIERFEKLSLAQCPLPPAVVACAPSGPVARSARRRARDLHSLERKLVADSDELALRGLSRKHRKRLLSKCRAGGNIADEIQQNNKKTKKQNNCTNGAWQVEETEPPKKKKKQKEDSSNKENEIKNKKNAKQTESNARKDDKQKKNNKIDKRDSKKNAVTDKKNTVAEEKPKKIENREEKSEKKSLKLVFKDNPKKIKSKTNENSTKNELKPALVVNKVKNFQKKTSPKVEKEVKTDLSFSTPKKVKFVLKNNSMQGTGDYYKSVKQSPNIPFDSTKKPTKTNLKPFTPSPINPFKKKMKLRSKYF